MNYPIPSFLHSRILRSVYYLPLYSYLWWHFVEVLTVLRSHITSIRTVMPKDITNLYLYNSTGKLYFRWYKFPVLKIVRHNLKGLHCSYVWNDWHAVITFILFYGHVYDVFPYQISHSRLSDSMIIEGKLKAEFILFTLKMLYVCPLLYYHIFFQNLSPDDASVSSVTKLPLLSS
jgi:hypothetical protein